MVFVWAGVVGVGAVFAGEDVATVRTDHRLRATVVCLVRLLVVKGEFVSAMFADEGIVAITAFDHLSRSPAMNSLVMR